MASNMERQQFYKARTTIRDSTLRKKKGTGSSRRSTKEESMTLSGRSPRSTSKRTTYKHPLQPKLGSKFAEKNPTRKRITQSVSSLSRSKLLSPRGLSTGTTRDRRSNGTKSSSLSSLELTPGPSSPFTPADMGSPATISSSPATSCKGKGPSANTTMLTDSKNSRVIFSQKLVSPRTQLVAVGSLSTKMEESQGGDMSPDNLGAPSKRRDVNCRRRRKKHKRPKGKLPVPKFKVVRRLSIPRNKPTDNDTSSSENDTDRPEKSDWETDSDTDEEFINPEIDPEEAKKEIEYINEQMRNFSKTYLDWANHETGQVMEPNPKEYVQLTVMWLVRIHEKKLADLVQNALNKKGVFWARISDDEAEPEGGNLATGNSPMKGKKGKAVPKRGKGKK